MFNTNCHELSMNFHEWFPLRLTQRFVKFEKFVFEKKYHPGGRKRLLGRTKVYGAKARSSEKLKFLSSQATLSYRVAVATDAKPRAEISSLNLCRGAKEENCKLTDAFIPRRRYRLRCNKVVLTSGGPAQAQRVRKRV